MMFSCIDTIAFMALNMVPQHLRSAGCHQLFVPRHRHSVFDRRVFSVVGPAAWNSLPDYLRDPSHSFDSFHRDMKTFFLVIVAYTAH